MVLEVADFGGVLRSLRMWVEESPASACLRNGNLQPAGAAWPQVLVI